MLAVTKTSLGVFVTASGLSAKRIQEIMNGAEAMPTEVPLIVKGINAIYRETEWTEADFNEVVFGTKQLKRKRNGSNATNV
jgi:hypothetical protein